MRKIIILILCCVVFASVVGCGGNTAPQPTESPSTTASETVVKEIPTETTPPKTEEPQEEIYAGIQWPEVDHADIERLVVEKINAYRIVQGDTATTMLPGLIDVARYRANELTINFEHRGEQHMYNDLAHGLMFVVGTEDMSKRHFIFMCLCPNLILGIIPYILFLLFPQLVGLGLFGIICIGMGFGDYLNIYIAIKQMPKNSKTYLCGMHSYWYL